jgi:hypothetical protein
MKIKTLLCTLAALPVAAGLAAASTRLSEAQMERVTAGQILGIECPGCTLSSSTSTSINGVTTTTSTIEITGTGGSGTGGGGGGGNGGGTGTGAGGGSNGPSPPGVVTSISPPPNVASVISGIGNPVITSH